MLLHMRGNVFEKHANHSDALTVVKFVRKNFFALMRDLYETRKTFHFRLIGYQNLLVILLY